MTPRDLWDLSIEPDDPPAVKAKIKAAKALLNEAVAERSADRVKKGGKLLKALAERRARK